MAEDLKVLVKRFYGEVMSQGKLDVIDEIIDADYVEHEELPGLGPGRDGLRAWVAMMRSAFPDLTVETLATVSEGDEVWVHALVTGTHKGELAGIPATGKQISMAMVDRVRVRDGKAVEHWGVSDDLGMMTQLGVIPEMG